MQIMKSPTIWESASRPLFVRSVWLEATTKNGRAAGATAQRHFILDYEPRRQSAQTTKSAASGGRRNKAYATLQHANSCDFLGDWREYKQTNECTEQLLPADLLLILPAKVVPLPPISNNTLQQQQQKQHRTKPLIAVSAQRNSTNQQKRVTNFLRNYATPYHHHHHVHGPLQELYELYSHHSSLQDLQSTFSQANSHADERLAERVLNWLDLAGKRCGDNQQQLQQQLDVKKEIDEKVKEEKVKVEAEKMVKPTQMTKKLTGVNKVMPSQPPTRTNNAAATSSSSSNTKTTRSANSQAQTHFQTKPQSAQEHPALTAARATKQVRYASAARVEQCAATNSSSSRAARSSASNTNTNTTATSSTDAVTSATTTAVKHVTIIFDCEGVPVRFNRPIRQIDLSTLSASPDTVRRLATSLASARLYSETEQRKQLPSRPPHSAPRRTMSSISRWRQSSDSVSSVSSRSSSAATRYAQKRTADAPPGFSDAKKQLHIFMPNLPNKNVSLVSGMHGDGGGDGGGADGSGCASFDETLSGLSNTFSEFCKI